MLGREVNKMAGMTPQDKKWRAEDDARILADSDVIKKDRTRLSAAIKAAKTMAKEQKERSTAMTKVAGMKVNVRGRK